MNAAYKTFGFVGAALFIAIASFQDSLALGMGKIGLIMAAAALSMLIVGAIFSFAMNGQREREALYASLPADDASDVETSHS